jgi:hypothetical protein
MRARPQGTAEDLLRELAAILDAAQDPISRLDVPRVEAYTRRQDELTRKLGSVLDGGQAAAAAGVDPALITQVRRKLLRNRVMVTHVLDFTSRLRARVAAPEQGSYGADGQTRNADAAGRLLRTSV